MRNILLVALLGVLLTPALHAQQAKPEAKQSSAITKDDVKTWTLDNGLEVVYLGVHKAPVVTVQVWYHVGSKDEKRDRRGSAHMFEHMMFKGTKNVAPEEYARHIDRVGGTVNAFTSYDTTAYHQTLPKQYMDFAVMLEAERMRNLVFRKEMVAKERQVVEEEKRVRVDNSPVGKAIERFHALAFTKHNYAWDAAGFIEDLEQLTPKELKAFYDLYYQPNNATLVIVGDVSEEDVKAAAQKYFGEIPKAKAPPRPADKVPEPKQKKLRREVVGQAQIGVIIGGYHIPPAKDKDLYPLQVAAAILSNGESSRLYQRIVRKDQIGVYAAGQVLALEHPGLFFLIGAYLQPEQGEKVEQALLEEVGRLATEKIGERELEKAKNQLAANFVFGLESVDGLASQIGMAQITQGDPRAWLDAYAAYQAVSADDVVRVAKAYLVPENLTMVVVPPTGQGAQGGGGQ